MQILIPIIQSGGSYIPIILNKDNKIVFILDTDPLNPIYKYNPNARYVKQLLWIAEHLPKAMTKICPGSRWTENIFLWRQVILDVPTHKR